MSFATGVDGATYYSYLLRMWQVPTNGDAFLAHSAGECTDTVRKRGFGSLDELLAYLRQLTSQKDYSSGEGR